jgi:tetratricopeptide (TPR) repeat protein
MARNLPNIFSRRAAAAAAVCLLCIPFAREGAAGTTQGDAALKKAEVLLQKKDFRRALEALAPALAESPRDPGLLNMKGSVLTRMKDYPAAQACYQEALESDPAFFPARYNLGSLLALQQKRDESKAYFGKLLDEQPSNELLQYKLLLLLLQEGEDSPLLSSASPGATPAWYYAKAARALRKGDAGEAARYVKAGRGIFGEQTAIYQEELDESGLAAR